MACTHNLYTLLDKPDDPELVDRIWSRYESRLSFVIDNLLSGHLYHNDWLRVLVPFAACLLVRAPEFGDRIKNRMTPTDIIYDYSGVNGARIMELQRLLAPILAANWIILTLQGDGQIITNDVGWTPYINRINGQKGMAIPLDRKHVLVLIPQMKRSILRVVGGKWVPIIEFDNLDPGAHLSLNDALSNAAQRFLIGPDDSSVMRHLRQSDQAPLLPEPHQLGFLSVDEARAHDFTWHRLVSAVSKGSTGKRSTSFDLNWPAIKSDWAPPVLIPDNLVGFPPALTRKGREIIVDFYNPEIYYDISRVLNTRDKKGLSEAVNKCNIVLERHTEPKSRAMLLALRATITDDLGMTQDSLSDFDAALRLDPSNMNALIDRAVAYIKLGQYDNAIHDCTFSISLNPRCGEAYLNRGVCYGELSDYSRALAEASKAIPNLPNGPSKGAGLHFRAQTLVMMKEYVKALDDFEAALRILPPGENKASCYYFRAICYGSQEREDLALDNLSMAIQLKPTFFDALVLRGQLLFKFHRFTEAIADTTSAIDISNNNQKKAEVLLLRGSCHIQNGDITEAILDFSEAINLEPNSADAFFERGTAHFVNADFAPSLSDLDSAIRLDDSYAKAYGNRGIVYRQQGDHKQAIQEFDHAIQLMGSSSEAASAYRNKAMSLAIIGHYAEAETAILISEKIAGGKSETLAARAYLEYSKGNFELAASIFQTISETQTPVLTPFPLLRLNKTEEALGILETIVNTANQPIARQIIRSELQRLNSIAPETPGLEAAWQMINHLK
jgi:tetratricopeptide (TPR) repeat protein